jgi:hypothetical protein
MVLHRAMDNIVVNFVQNQILHYNGIYTDNITVSIVKSGQYLLCCKIINLQTDTQSG